MNIFRLLTVIIRRRTDFNRHSIIKHRFAKNLILCLQESSLHWATPIRKRGASCRQAAKPKRQSKTVIHFVYFIASIIPFLSYIFCISFCNPNFSPRIICIHHREIHQFHFHRVQRIFSSKAWKQRNRKLISTYR